MRAALQEFVMRFDEAEDNGKYPRRRVSGVCVDRERFERAAAVLAQAKDE